MGSGPAYVPSLHGPLVKIVVTGQLATKRITVVRTNFIAANIFTEPFREETEIIEGQNAGVVILDQMIAQLQRFREAVLSPETPALPPSENQGEIEKN